MTQTSENNSGNDNEETGEKNGGTRTRTRTRARVHGSETAEKTGGGARNRTSPSDEDAGEKSGGRRRGRRGRRGRGRGGQGGDTSTDARDGGGKGAEKSKSDRNGGGGGRSKAGDGARGRSKGRGDTTDEQATEEAIAKGGTRMAAKRGGRGGGSRGGGRTARPTGVPEEVRRAILDGPPRTMLVTAQPDRTQIAVLEDRTVVEHFVTRKEDVTYVGNVYMARVQNVLPGMEAAFLDIGKGRNGVLYAGEVLFDELDVEEGVDEPRIEDVLKQGQTVLVQVTKDPMGTKGPRLTMHLSLAGRYMVLAPNSELFGISRKLTEKERDRLRKVVKKVKPDHHGVIVRTAAENATEEQVTADLERLLAKWDKVEERAAQAKALSCVYEEPPLVVKVIRDNFGPEFERCVVDSAELYAQVREYLEEVAPELMDKVELYGQETSSELSAGDSPAADAPTVEESDAAEATSGDDGQRRTVEAPAQKKTSPKTKGTEKTTAKTTTGTKTRTKAKGKAGTAAPEPRPALFEAYNVDEQLRKAMSRKVWLPSGGYLIIESTEAMKVIDVNTGKFTGDAKSNLEEVVLKTNLEAADEIVRQLRLRDLGGIIIIDFIDMLLKSNQDQVVRRLKRELLRDRTKTRVSEVSRLGLVQMTRKNVSQGLVEVFSHKCDTCDGHGFISDLEE